MSTTSVTSAGEGEEDAAIAATREEPVPRQDEPNLYNFPSSFHPIYRPLPLLAKLIVALTSMLISAITTWQHLTWLDPLVAVRSGKTPSVKKIVQFLGKALIAGFLSNTVLQDVFLPPTRISTADLERTYFLPSSLSRYEHVTLPSRNESMGVHFLKCTQPSSPEQDSQFQAIYMNHGFGASSLSWLPVLPSLLKRMGGRAALAHDAPGFGFTDRPSNVTAYTRKSSAEIGSNLLQSALGKDEPSSVALFGHSMGAAPTLRMALSLPKETRKFIVLVGPALGLMDKSMISKSRLSTATRPVRQFVRNFLFDPPFSYILKRAVG